MYQTMASAWPSVVVTIGAGGRAGHRRAPGDDGAGGFPGAIRTATTARPLTPPGHMFAPLVVEKTK